jgi:hypothetical protein
MTVELIALVPSGLAMFTCGVLIGYRISARRLAARARRQDAAQLSLYRQLHELQAARQEDDAARMKAKALQPA